jgi:hypothetical protein
VIVDVGLALVLLVRVVVGDARVLQGSVAGSAGKG